MVLLHPSDHVRYEELFLGSLKAAAVLYAARRTRVVATLSLRTVPGILSRVQGSRGGQ